MHYSKFFQKNKKKNLYGSGERHVDKLWRFLLVVVEWVVRLREHSRSSCPLSYSGLFFSIPLCGRIILLLSSTTAPTASSGRVVEVAPAQGAPNDFQFVFVSAIPSCFSFFFFFSPLLLVPPRVCGVYRNWQEEKKKKKQQSKQPAAAVQLPGVWSVLIDGENEPRVTRLDCC